MTFLKNWRNFLSLEFMVHGGTMERRTQKEGREHLSMIFPNVSEELGGPSNVTNIRLKL